MRKAFIFLFFFAFIKANSQVNLIPQPVEIKQSSGFYLLTKNTSISFNSTESRKLAEMLVQRLIIPTGFKLNAQQGNKGDIELNLNDLPNQQIGKEGYILEVTANGVKISANQTAGLFYGLQTLFQLLPPEIESRQPIKADWKIPRVKITDYPRFGWRGIMLDVSRHFFSKEEVKAYIDQISKFKYNTFHWHLTDDHGWRIEIKSLPKLTEVGAWRVARAGYFGERPEQLLEGETGIYGGFYTQADIKEVIQYAQDRNVTIIPEIDVPGHCMAMLAAYPELSCTKDIHAHVNSGTGWHTWYDNDGRRHLIEGSLNPSDEKVYEFLDKVYSEVAALFPNPYIHVGGDECVKKSWAKDPGCQALMKKLNTRHVEDLEGYFMTRVEQILTSKGKKLLGWDEIVEGGISPQATVMSWRGSTGGIEAAKMGHEVVMTPYQSTYLDLQQGEASIEPIVYDGLRLKKCYGFEPVPEGVDAKYVLGGQGNLWTEHVPNFRHVEYMTYPRAWALAEVFWSPKDKKNWDNFVTRTENQFVRADVAEINYSRAMYDAIVTSRTKADKLWLEMETEVPDLTIYYTIDDTMPDSHCTKYTNPVELPVGAITLRAITYRNGKPIGHLITLKLEELKKRSVN